MKVSNWKGKRTKGMKEAMVWPGLDGLEATLWKAVTDASV